MTLQTLIWLDHLVLIVGMVFHQGCHCSGAIMILMNVATVPYNLTYKALNAYRTTEDNDTRIAETTP